MLYAKEIKHRWRQQTTTCRGGPGRRTEDEDEIVPLLRQETPEDRSQRERLESLRGWPGI